MSDAVYMKKKPAHFLTRIANPYTRYGDKPYIQCPHCNKLTTGLGFKNHYRACLKKGIIR